MATVNVQLSVNPISFAIRYYSHTLYFHLKTQLLKMMMEEIILLLAILLLLAVVIGGTAVMIWARRSRPTAAISDLENRLKSYLESSELDTLEFSEYLEKMIGTMETAARYRMNPPKIVISDAATDLDQQKEQSDDSTQFDYVTAQAGPQIIEVKPLPDVTIQIERD